LRIGDDPIVTAPLLDALTACLDRREQALLLLNRRGYATSLLCRECATPAVCPNCSVSLTVHGAGRVVDCHYCGHHTRTPPARAVGGCRRCRCRPGHARLPRRRALLPTPDAGRRPRRPRRSQGRRPAADASARSLRADARLRPGLRAVLRARDGIPPHDGLSA